MTDTFFEQLNQFGRASIPFVFLVDFELKKPVVFPISAVNPEIFLYQFQDIKNYHFFKTTTKPIKLKKYPISFERYQKSFALVQKHLRYGNSYLVNLTFPTRIDLNYDLKTIFYLSQAKYKIWFRDEFVCFSPETFIKIRDGIISTFPMKGTIKSSLPEAYQKILHDKKEFAEHATIVDLLRNDLSRIAENVQVKRFRFADEIQTDSGENLLQISSEIIGKLPQNYKENIGTILQKLLPAGSISGAPKTQTFAIIQEAEGYERGFYTGICGYFDGTNLDSGVMIRFIENTSDGFLFKSGGGITTQSEAQSEYQEMLDKVYLAFR